MKRGSEPRRALVVEPVVQSPAMKQFDAMLRVIARKDVTVTLIGESGTGKEVMARRLHELSTRSRGPFVPINCAAIPEGLFESELFGHERGAFTSANERAIGKVESASGGTLFLDEVAELTPAHQAKLLRFLESRRFMRVGGNVKLEADVRLVFASLRPLDTEVRVGKFRADLYYRLQGLVLEIPPLRERPADLLPLLETFVLQLSAFHGCEPPIITRSARAALLAHDWPGNVRELRNLVELLCILYEGKRVRASDLPGALRRPQAQPATVTLPLDRPLAELVDRITRAVVTAEGGNLTRAAARLKISLRTLQRRRG